jgi:hypothetical protein
LFEHAANKQAATAVTNSNFICFFMIVMFFCGKDTNKGARYAKFTLANFKASAEYLRALAQR